MSPNEVLTKAGWIHALRYLALAIPNPETIGDLAPVTVANATDLPTAVALANANKVAINAIIAAIKDRS